MKKPLSDRIQQHRPDWDKEAFWSQLEPELPRQPKRQRAVWWWLTGGLLLAVLALGLYIRPGSAVVQALPIPLPTTVAASHLPQANPNPKSIGSVPFTVPPAAPVIQREGPSKTGLEKASAYAPAAQKPSAAIPERASTSLVPMLQEEQTEKAHDYAASTLPTLPLRHPTLAERPFSLQLSRETAQLPVASSQSRWFYTLQFGLANSLRTYRSTEGIPATAMARQGEIREAIALAYHVGWQHPSGWFAQMGIAVQQRRELLDWEGVVDSTSVRRSVDEAYAYTGQGGLTLYQSGEVEVTELTRRRIVQHNYFYTLDVPLSVGYRSQIGRWALQAQAGVRLNLWHRFRGKWVSDDFQVLGEAEVNTNVIRPTLGIGWSAGTGLGYQLRSGIEAFGLLSYQRFDASITRGQAYRTSYQQWGMQFGIRRYF